MHENQCSDPIPCWTVPEGVYTGSLIEFGTYHQRMRSGLNKQYYRLVFELETDDPYREYRAQKRYAVNEKLSAAVTKDLTRWLGKKAILEKQNIQLHELLGHKAKITVEHMHGEGYKKPFSIIKRIGPVKSATKKIGKEVMAK